MLPYFNNPALSFSPQCLALFNTPYIFLIYLVYYSFPPQEFSLHKGWNLCLVHCCFLCLENNIVSNIGSVSIHGMNIEYILLSLLCKEKAKFRDTKKKKIPDLMAGIPSSAGFCWKLVTILQGLTILARRTLRFTQME